VYGGLIVRNWRWGFAFSVLLTGLAQARPASAQVEPCPKPPTLPPANSPVLLNCMQIIAHPVNETVVDSSTYGSHIKTPQTLPSQNIWATYDEASVQSDFWNLWRTGFLDNLWIEVIDEPFENGVAGKHVIFHIEERPRVKFVDYAPSRGDKLKIEQSKIEELMTERNAQIRIDSFIDQSAIRKVKGIITELYAEKGYADAKVTTSLTELPSGPKLVQLTFTVDEGPKLKVGEVVFDGNTAFSDGKLRGRMKDNKPRGFFGFITGGGTYQPAKMPDDVDKITEFYQNEGYVRAVVGAHQVETIKDSRDGRTRHVRLRMPIDEGIRYKVGAFNIADNTMVKAEFLRPLFKVQTGDYYNANVIRKGLQETQKVYGMGGFYQFTPRVEACPRGTDCQTLEPIAGQEQPPIVDVTIRMIEGKQFFVNRVTFVGNTTTRDNVVRRELRVYEGGVFNSNALTDSIRRLNQLGYFKPLEGKTDEIQITPVPKTDNRVDLQIKVEEQNRNQISFGAGVSQFDGFFGQLSFQTSNFLGRGETVGISLQRGSQARQYQVSFSEPYLWDRPITFGTDIYSREVRYPLLYSQRSQGMNFLVGYPLADYTRLYMGYSYEKVHVFDISSAYVSETMLANNPQLRASLLIDKGGRQTVSKITPSLVFNTVNHPIFPTDGKKLTASMEFAGPGGNTTFWQARVDGIWYIPLSAKTAIGLHGEGQYVIPRGDTQTLPIFEKFFQGGEYSVRGFDLRTIGPRDPISNLVIGGNKSLVFNAELYYNIAGPVRVLGFFDAGQVQDFGVKLRWKDPITELRFPNQPLLTGPLGGIGVLTPLGGAPQPQVVTVGETHAFKTSTGVELRFFMPVLNVPFRLIGAYNPSRRGVYNNNLSAQEKFTFRFAVGVTF
jgi:outer membrane protein insertion porin family